MAFTICTQPPSQSAHNRIHNLHTTAFSICIPPHFHSAHQSLYNSHCHCNLHTTAFTICAPLALNFRHTTAFTICTPLPSQSAHHYLHNLQTTAFTYILHITLLNFLHTTVFTICKPPTWQSAHNPLHNLHTTAFMICTPAHLLNRHTTAFTICTPLPLRFAHHRLHNLHNTTITIWTQPPYNLHTSAVTIWTPSHLQSDQHCLYKSSCRINLNYSEKRTIKHAGDWSLNWDFVSANSCTVKSERIVCHRKVDLLSWPASKFIWRHAPHCGSN